jgi:hypothetical protein
MRVRNQDLRLGLFRRAEIFYSTEILKENGDALPPDVAILVGLQFS